MIAGPAISGRVHVAPCRLYLANQDAAQGCKIPISCAASRSWSSRPDHCQGFGFTSPYLRSYLRGEINGLLKICVEKAAAEPKARPATKPVQSLVNVRSDHEPDTPTETTARHWNPSNGGTTSPSLPASERLPQRQIRRPIQRLYGGGTFRNYAAHHGIYNTISSGAKQNENPSQPERARAFSLWRRTWAILPPIHF